MREVLELYNEIWVNCVYNMEISILKYIDKDNEYFAYRNNYIYEFKQEETGGGAKLTTFSVEQPVILFKDFADEVTKGIISKEEFLSLIREHLQKDNGIALVDVDLYHWLQDSLCWEKYHWHHYSLLTNYDKEKQVFRACDELNGQYIDFFVSADKIYENIAFDSEYRSKLRLLTLRDQVSIQEITVDDVISNAKSIIQSLKEGKQYLFWDLPEEDFIAKSYLDLSGVYLQRIEGRQRFNEKLIEYLGKKVQIDLESIQKYKDKFAKLAFQWNRIRLQLYKLYINKKQRKANMLLINETIQSCFQDEIEIWIKLISILAEVE